MRFPPIRLAALVSFVAAPALADPSAADKAAAERLFDAARKLSDAGNHAEACPKYAESHRFDPAVGTLMYLADCYEKTNKLASAWATWRDAVAAARREGQKDRERTASERAAAAEKKVPSLAIEVPAAARVSGLEVRRDGDVVGPALWGAAIPVDPGTYKVEATALGRTTWSATIDVTVPGETKTVTVPELKSVPSSPPVAASSSAPAAQPPTPPPVVPTATPASNRKPIAYAVGGVGVVGLVAGSFFGLRTMSKNSASKDHCRTDTLCDSTGLALRDDAKSAGALSTVFFAVGVVGVGVGATLYLTAPRSEEATTVSVDARPGSASLQIGRVF